MGKIFDYDGVPVLHTTSGDLKGYFYDGVYIYKGIPYAYADRFQMPVPSKWDGVKDATNYGFVCPLQNQDTPNGELMVPHRYWPQDEHCQSLNIWTNKLDPEAKKPVLVWFHGGGYAAGSSIEQVAYDGVSIAKKGDSILVSVNHRLNILGYLDLSPFGEKYKNSANAGHADMVAALQWVHDNIALFGGDPENVTIFGQSGGGMKVIDLMQIPSADGLFQKGLVMSGVMEDDPLGAGEKDGTEIITAMMKALGFDDVAQLETVPYPQLAAAYAKVAPAIAQSGGYIGGGPKKGDYFYGNPFDAGFREHVHQIPMMIGTVYGEFATFAPAAYDKNKLTAEEILEILKKVYGDNAEKVLDAFKEAYPEKNGVDVLAIDRAMREPTVKLAKLFAKGGGKAYLYNFALEFPFQHGKPAWHCSDIPYFFGNADLVEICGIPDVSDKLESEIFGALLAFAKNGTPDHAGLPHWPEVEAEDADTMVFDRKTEVKHNYDDKVFAEINKVLKPWSFMDMMADNIQH